MTAIGVTASITLLTGLPGSGKSLRAVHHMLAMVAAGEIVFHTNFSGLNVPGTIPWPDPKDWKNIPTGGILFVDEAQEFFRARRAGDPPSYLTDMERIRHGGVRLVLVTQQPNYLDAHLRGLVGLHEHLKRENGTQAAKIYRCNEIMDDVRSSKAAAKYDSEVWKYPKEVFSAYKSAEVHTVQYVMPSKLKRWGKVMAFAAVALLTGIGLLVYKVSSAGESAAAAGERAEPAEPSLLPASRYDDQEREQPLTVEQYVERMVPRIPEALYSAPIFDDRQAESEPEVFCMASDEWQGQPATCTCLTEQGTRYQVEPLSCVTLARHGTPYNPFKAPVDRPAPPAAQEALPQPVAAPAGIRGSPAEVGHPEQGSVWGRRPETVRADWGG